MTKAEQVHQAIMNLPYFDQFQMRTSVMKAAELAQTAVAEYERRIEELERRNNVLERAADRMARVAVDWVDRKLIDSRSALADALLDYAEIRLDATSGDAVRKLRLMFEAKGPTA